MILMVEEIPLFRKYPKLATIPWVPVIDFPTSVHKMEQTSKTLKRNIWVKRDDLTHSIYGGNKPRKYEFVFADILKKGKKTIITLGSIGTNHGLAATVTSRDFGLSTHLFVLEQPISEDVRENLLCHHFFGAKLHLMRSPFHRKLAMKIKLIFDRSSYFVTLGASSPLGTLGFVNAAFELKEQIEKKVVPEPDKLFVTVGSLATCAGLVLGLELAKVKTKIVGIGVTDPVRSSKQKTIELAIKALEIMRHKDNSIPDVSKEIENRLIINHSYFGGQYGASTKEALEAIEIAKQDELKLDHTYTGKTLGGLIDYCQKDKVTKNEVVLFWNSKSSTDMTPYLNQITYQDLPKKFHRFFETK
ncbi:MAG: 1-aminocyclopropane-1-carboxylate deaminase/D-cysteine desulfhydrase [Candidatus Heimdallarchaeaceae archaeon]